MKPCRNAVVFALVGLAALAFAGCGQDPTPPPPAPTPTPASAPVAEIGRAHV